jgi:acyl CoA:acetate/3-ketoacid CoA transferase beta subunit
MYTSTELLACVAAKLLEGKKSVFVGTGLPMIAGMLAQRTHAPNLLIIFEAGGIGPQVPVLPISVGDCRTFHRAVAASSMHDVMSACQAGYVDYGFLGAAMIDAHGNINTTVIGDWERPTVRLPGSGGANDIGSFCHRTIIMMRQDKRRFVEKVDLSPRLAISMAQESAKKSDSRKEPVLTVSSLSWVSMTLTRRPRGYDCWRCILVSPWRTSGPTAPSTSSSRSTWVPLSHRRKRNRGCSTK